MAQVDVSRSSAQNPLHRVNQRYAIFANCLIMGRVGLYSADEGQRARWPRSRCRPKTPGFTAPGIFRSLLPS